MHAYFEITEPRPSSPIHCFVPANLRAAVMYVLKKEDTSATSPVTFYLFTSKTMVLDVELVELHTYGLSIK
jgi:hypothetical protein